MLRMLEFYATVVMQRSLVIVRSPSILRAFGFGEKKGECQNNSCCSDKVKYPWISVRFQPDLCHPYPLLDSPLQKLKFRLSKFIVT